jgi:hypothetical protein
MRIIIFNDESCLINHSVILRRLSLSAKKPDLIIASFAELFRWEEHWATRVDAANIVQRLEYLGTEWLQVLVHIFRLQYMKKAAI